MGSSWFNALEKMERFLRFFAIITFTGFISLQSFTAQGSERFYWKFADYLEGEYVTAVSPQAGAGGAMCIRLDERACMPWPAVKINGRTAAYFTGQEIMLPVRNGDLITIDGAACSRVLTYRVIRVSPGLAWPPLHYRVQTNASSVLLGKVKIERASR